MDSFEKEIGEAFSNSKIPFVDYGLTRSGAISLEGIFRHSDFPSLSQNKNKLFRMASMTKPLTAYLTLAVLEDNAIDLQESVGNYVPEIDNLQIAYMERDVIKYRKNDVPISFHHLLSCTSGHAYEHHEPIVSELISRKEIPPMKNGDDAFLKAPLVFKPGSRWGYGISYGWLGKAIEAISGASLDENLRKYLCYPLELTHTSFNPSQSKIETLQPVFFRGSDGAYSDISSKMTLGLNPFHYGGGGITSTLSDYLKILQFLLKSMKSGIKSPIVSQMFKNQIGNFDIPPLKSYNQNLVLNYDIHPNVKKSWGYGLLINDQPLAQRRSEGSGSWAGILNTYFWIDHKNDLAGVFLTQILPCYSHQILKAFEYFEELSYKYFVKS